MAETGGCRATPAYRLQGSVASPSTGHSMGRSWAVRCWLTRRYLRSEVAVFALVVDAKDGAAEAFYRHHGFERLGTKARQLIVALKNFAHEADIGR